MFSQQCKTAPQPSLLKNKQKTKQTKKNPELFEQTLANGRYRKVTA